MNIASIIILVIVSAILILDIIYLWKTRKKPKCSCASCPYCDKCHGKCCESKKENK